MCFFKKKAKIEHPETNKDSIKVSKDEKKIEDKNVSAASKTPVLSTDKSITAANSNKSSSTKKVPPKVKQYIVQKSPTNKKKWEVVVKGGTKALKLFDTEPEASEYARVTAKNQKGSTLKRASKGVKKGKFVSSKK